MPELTDSDVPFVIATLVVFGTLFLFLFWRFWFSFRHGDRETRRKRKRALLKAPIRVDTPFEVAGVGQSGPLMLYLDIDLNVPWDAEATIEQCGVVLDYEVWVDDQAVETCRVSMPSESRNRQDVNMFVMLGIRTRLRHACQVDKLHRMRDGAKLVLRGRATPKPENTINELTIWVA